ncbi:TonB-dependent receptor [Sphingosinicella sp. LHD-64]|uniref:TonB-dependent receptor n=1 Tax=Sphingosinicella sp. LHD-64 TaxID=3072139 RepID=UPI00280F9563|nr:TonB-dependent receptor [Sphingosinicella sp. LHD-64]MDQ8757571.1 TonB-dependent receptor [Sphingosinicella sp. LHD-64]
MANTSRIAIAISTLGGLVWSGPTLAQAEDSPASTEGTTRLAIAAGQNPAPASRATAPEEDEIVVTAQRREERLSDVPISVSVLGGDTLQQNVIVSTNDLTVAVPGLNWGRSTNFSQPTIRGVGSRNASAGDEPNVATFVDGVYLPDMTGTLFELSNIERIEVLRGPQGTLFGRNATGGAINVVTRRPTRELEGSIAATVGEFGYYRLGGYISGPIAGDVITASLTAVHYDDDGYVENIFNGETQGSSGGTAFRARVRFEPADDISFEVNGFHSKSNNNVLISGYAINGNTQARNSIPGGPNAGALNPTGIPADRVIADEPFTTATFSTPFGRTRQRFIDMHMDWDIGFATLTGTASWGDTQTTTLSWTDVSPIRLSQTEYSTFNDFSNQELVLTSNPGRFGRFEWLLGLTRFQSDAQFNPLVSTGRNATTGAFLPTRTIYGQNTRAFAVFGEVTWQAVDNLFFTGGLRYNRDDKDAFNLNALTSVRTEGEARFENVSPRGVVRWEFAPSSNVYLSYTRGFKSGTFNAVAAAGTQLPAEPEIVDAYELGVKTRLARGITLEAAAFRYNYQDLQVSTPVVINGVSATTVQNAGEARINGFEASLNAQVTRNLSFNAAVTLLDSELRDFPNASVQVPRSVGGVPTNNGNVNVVVDVSGNELIRAPDWTFSLGATYRHELFGGEMTYNATAFFSSSYFFDLTNRLSQPSYEVVNASITWREGPDRGFYASVFAQNLTDQTYAAGFIISSFIDGTQANKPRWFGATVGFNF